MKLLAIPILLFMLGTYIEAQVPAADFNSAEVHGSLNNDFIGSANLAGSWSFGAGLIPTGRYYAGSVMYTRNDTAWLYIFGGDTTGGGVPSATCSRYNLITNTWERIAPLPVPTRLNNAARVGDRLYSFGGYTGSGSAPPVASVYEYNVNLNMWTQIQDMPEPLFYVKGAGYQDSLLYILGGAGIAERGNELRFNVRLLNINKGSWRDASDMPDVRADGAVTLSGNKLFYVGGYIDDVSTSSTTFVGTIDNFDRSSINWQLKATYLGGSIGRLNAYNWGTDKILIGGGSATNGFDVSSQFYTYNITDDIYVELNARANPGRTAYMGGTYTRLNFNRSEVEAVFVLTGGVAPGPAVTAQTNIYTDTVTITGLVPDNVTSPHEFYLSQNFPNPFNPETIINFSLPQKNFTQLKVFDAVGKEVDVLIEETLNAGEHKISWNAGGIASGVYFYRLKSGNYSEIKKMLLIR